MTIKFLVKHKCTAALFERDERMKKFKLDFKIQFAFNKIISNGNPFKFLGGFGIE
jgi:hypothetical protein